MPMQPRVPSTPTFSAGIPSTFGRPQYRPDTQTARPPVSFADGPPRYYQASQPMGTAAPSSAPGLQRTAQSQSDDSRGPLERYIHAVDSMLDQGDFKSQLTRENATEHLNKSIAWARDGGDRPRTAVYGDNPRTDFINAVDDITETLRVGRELGTMKETDFEAFVQKALCDPYREALNATDEESARMRGAAFPPNTYNQGTNFAAPARLSPEGRGVPRTGASHYGSDPFYTKWPGAHGEYRHQGTLVPESDSAPAYDPDLISAIATAVADILTERRASNAEGCASGPSCHSCGQSTSEVNRQNATRPQFTMIIVGAGEATGPSTVRSFDPASKEGMTPQYSRVPGGPARIVGYAPATSPTSVGFAPRGMLTGSAAQETDTQSLASRINSVMPWYKKTDV
jgi:hypothetical protein